MGAWGTGIFSDDTAQEVRDEWREAVLEGLSPEDATARLVKRFDDYLGEDENTEKLFWVALAAVQFETGRLLAEVRDRAIAIIERGGDVARWREDGDDVLARQRERVLERLAEKLRGRQPKPKRLRRPPSLPSVAFEVGDVVRVHDEHGENESLVLVVGHMNEPGVERAPIVAALDWEGGAIPDRDALSRLDILPDPYAPRRRLLIWVSTTSKRDIFGPHVGEVVANDVTPSERVDARRFAHTMGWRLVASAVRDAQLHAGERRRD